MGGSWRVEVVTAEEEWVDSQVGLADHVYVLAVGTPCLMKEAFHVTSKHA